MMSMDYSLGVRQIAEWIFADFGKTLTALGIFADLKVHIARLQIVICDDLSLLCFREVSF